jgi:hypothetical protein
MRRTSRSRKLSRIRSSREAAYDRSSGEDPCGGFLLSSQEYGEGCGDPEEFREYDLVGFGSGIDSDKHDAALLDLADELPRMDHKKAFIFSTCGIPVSAAGEGSVKKYSAKSHSALREKLTSRGYTIIGEYSCPGFNTNSLLRLFGGLNKGRPSAGDLSRAEEFARTLKAMSFT